MKQFYVFLMSFALVIQIISNGLFIPMTASAIDDTTVEQTNDDTQKLEQAKVFIADLFTDDTHIDIKNTVTDAQLETAKAYANAVADETAQKPLMQQIALAQAFLTVNALLDDDHIAKDVTSAMVAAAKTAVEAVEGATKVSEASLSEKLALVTSAMKASTEDAENKEEVVKSKKVKTKALATTAAISGTTDLKTYITNIELTEGYQSADPLDLNAGLKVNQEFGVKADLQFTDDVEAGTVFTYKIPAGTYVKDAGSVDLTGDIKGKLAWSTDGTIKLTVSEALQANTTGGFVFRSWVASSVTETPWILKYETKEPTGKEIPLTIKEANKPAPTFTKKGSNNGISYDTKTLTYTVEFSGVENAQYVKDTLPAGVQFNEIVSVTRAEYNVFTGQYGEAKADQTSWTSEATDNIVNFKRQGDIGLDKYIMQYTVNVIDPQTLTSVGANKVDLVGNTSNVKEVSSGTFTINHAEPYEKYVEHYDASNQVVTWRIVYNLNGKNLGAQEVNDYFSDGFTFDNLKVYKATLGKNDNGSPKAIATTEQLSNVSATTQKAVKENCPDNGTACQHVAIQMPAVNDTYIIEYQTKADHIVADEMIKNKAMIGSQTVSKNYSLTNTLGVKVGTGVDYTNKIASWKITLNTATNSDAKINAGAVITDTFEVDGMTLDEDSFVVKVGNGTEKKLSDYNISLETLANNSGFKLTFNEEVSKNTVITYNTHYDIIGNKVEKVRNSAKITYNNNLVASLKGYDQLLNAEAVNDGNKSGVYDPATKTITWTVNINYYAKEIAAPILTDTLKSNQTYVENSLKVYNATVNKDGSISRGSDATSTWTQSDYANQKSFTLTGPEKITSPYQIVYQTKIDAASDVHAASTYENTATLTSNDQTVASFTKTPSNLNNGDEFINKSSNKQGNKQYNWTVNINRSQSELNNVVIEDTQTGTLALDANSFVLKRTDYVNGKAVTTKIPVTIADTAPTSVEADQAVAVMTGDRYFKLYLGDISRAYTLTYTSYYEGQPTGEPLTNNAKMYVNDETKAAGGTEGVTIAVDQVAYVTGLAWLNYKPTLSLHKIAAQTSNGVDVKVSDLANIQFKLYDETQKVVLDQGTTDETGHVTFNKPLATGYYYLVEETTSNEYKPFGENYKGAGYDDNYVSTQDQTLPLTTTIDGKRAIRVEVSAKTVNTDKQVAFTVKNYLKTPTGCQQTFINKDGDKALKGSEYKVTDQEGNIVVENIKADNDGKIVTPTLPKGEYVLVQTKTPDGYDAENEKAEDIHFTVTDQCDTTIKTVENTHGCKDFVITFTNAEAFPDYTAQSTFKLVDQDGKTVTSMDGVLFDHVTFDENGRVTLTNVPTGTYQLVQVDVPVGYKKMEDIDVSVNSQTCKAGMTVEIPANDDTVACPDFYIAVEGLTAADERYTDNATFKLVDENGAVVTSNDKPLTDLTINEDNKIVLGDEVVGSTQLPLQSEAYTLVQTNTVTGYKVLHEKVVADGTDCKAIVTVDPTICPNYYIQVVDEAGESITQSADYATYVEKATFVLKGSDDTTIENVTIGTDGQLSVDGEVLNKTDLQAPHYTLVQTNSVDGFYKLTAQVVPQADQCYAIVTIHVADHELACTETQFIVKDVPAGVTYVIENADHTTSYTLQTVEKDGEVTLQPAEGSTMPKVLPTGEYTITTTKVPAGYAKAPVQTITVTDENGPDCVVPVTLTVIDCPDFTVYYEGPAKSTATFTLREKDGDVVEENIAVVTDENGQATLHFTTEAAKHLQAGTYELVQTTTPSGYYQASTQTITVTDDECVGALTVRNLKIPPVVVPPVEEICKTPTITVTTSTGDQPAPNTLVTVTVDDKTTTGKVTSDGKVSFDKEPTIKPGDQLTVVVDGYEPTTTTINEKDCTTTITVTPVKKACDHFTVHVVDEDGYAIPTVKLTVAGETVKTTNGTYTFDQPLAPGTEITLTKKHYEAKMVIVTKNNCDITVTLTKINTTLTTDDEDPTTSTTPGEEMTPDGDDQDPTSTTSTGEEVTPGGHDQDPTSATSTGEEVTPDGDDQDPTSATSTGEEVTPDGDDQDPTSSASNSTTPTVDPTTDEVGDGSTADRSSHNNVLPQTGEQIALYSLLGLLLMAVAVLLFRRARHQS